MLKGSRRLGIIKLVVGVELLMLGAAFIWFEKMKHSQGTLYV